MGVFTEEMWVDIAEGVGLAFAFSSTEQDGLNAKKVPKLIAGLPFLADCDDPDRFAVAHLATFLLELKDVKFEGKSVGACRESDLPDVFKRLEMLGNFSGGNKSIIDRGMRVLAWCMIDGYIETAVDDDNNKIYNPVNDGKYGLSYCNKMKDILKDDIDAVPCEAMDDILSITAVRNPVIIGTDTWWMM